MTKSELIDAVAAKANIPKAKAALLVQGIFDAMNEGLRCGEGVDLRGFGSFVVRNYEAYDGRNPRTGEVVQVAKKRSPFFKVAKALRERIDGAREKHAILTDDASPPDSNADRDSPRAR